MIVIVSKVLWKWLKIAIINEIIRIHFVDFHLFDCASLIVNLTIIIIEYNMKRSKNIFNSPIAHESLLEDEGNR